MALRAKAIETLPTYSSLHLLEGTYQHDAREWLHTIQVPTLVVVGDQDLMVQAHHARFLQQSIPGAQLHIIQGAGHAAWLEKADEFNRTMRDFLSA
jgi:3-oxoadipate enol-lactonase